MQKRVFQPHFLSPRVPSMFINQSKAIVIVRNCITEVAWAWSWSQSFKVECTPSGIMQLWNFTIFHCY